MSTAIIEKAREAAEASHKRAVEAQQSAIREEREKQAAQMRRDAEEQLGPEILDGAVFDDEELIISLAADVALKYEPERYDGVYGYSGRRFYLAQWCAECDRWVYGTHQVGARHRSHEAALVDLGEAIAAGVQHNRHDHELEELEEAKAQKPSDAKLAGMALAKAEAAWEAGDQEVAFTGGLIAVARYLSLLLDAVYWHGGER